VQLVEEPVEVEEGGGELVEDEGGAVEVDEGSLRLILAWPIMHRGVPFCDVGQESE